MPSSNGLIFKRIIAIALFTILIHWSVAESQESILDSQFTFRTGSIKTGNALNIISRQTGFNFTYDSELINPEEKTELTFINQKLNSILTAILKNDSLTYSVIDKYIIISRVILAPSVKVDSIPADVPSYVSGIILDDESGEPLSFATAALKNNGKGSIANLNGEFRLIIPFDCMTDTLSVSYLGFMDREIPVEQALGNNFTIRMKREFISIPEIIIRTKFPQDIISKALASISQNYGNTPALLNGFYREGVMKKQELQVYSEAILKIYKSSYTGSFQNDQIKVLKSRKIENRELQDTLAIRLKAGLSTCLELDGIKNIFDFLSRESMPDYIYRMTDIVSVDDDAAFVIDFEQKEGVEVPLYKGSVYINTDDYAVLHADFELHPKYINKMKDTFVTSTSRGFITWPVTVKYSTSYRKVNDRYFLSHVRGDLVFLSRQKQKLFNTQFKVFFELAITGMSTDNVTRFEKEELAPIHSIFSKTLPNYDPAFWENQDFLKPEDNLLQELKNMNVRLLEYSDDQN